MTAAGSYGLAAAGMGHLHPSSYIPPVPQMAVASQLGYGSNAGVMAGAGSPAGGSSFMPVPMHSMASVIQHRTTNSGSTSSGQESGKQRRSSSSHRYTPIAPAPPAPHPTNSTSVSNISPSPATSTGYYIQHAGSHPPGSSTTPQPRPPSQYLPSSSPNQAAVASCSLAKLQQLTNGLADVSSSPHHTMTPPPNQTPPPPSHLHGLGHGHVGLGHGHHGHSVVPTPPPAGMPPQHANYAKYYQGSVPSPIPVSPSPGIGLNPPASVGAIHSNDLPANPHGVPHNPSVTSGTSGRSSTSSGAPASSSSSGSGRNSSNNNNSQRGVPPVTINSQLMQYQLNGSRMSMAGMAGMGMAGMAGVAGMGMAGMGMMAAQHQALNPASYITNPGFINQSHPMPMGVMNMHAHAAAAHAAQHGHAHAPPHGAHAASATQAAQYQDQRTATQNAMYTTYGYINSIPQLNGTMRR